MDALSSTNEKSSFEGGSSLETKESSQNVTVSTAAPDLESGCNSPSSQELTPAPEFSEGGLRGWLSVLGGAIMSFCTFGVVQSFGVYQDYYTRVSLSEKTASEISWIGSAQVFLLFAIGLPAGKLMEMGYYRHTTIAGTLIYSISMFMLSLVQPHHYYQTFLAQGMGVGLGMGMLFLPTLTITSHYFRKRRSLAMGVVVSGGSIGGCLYPVLLNNVFNSSAGYGWGIRAVGFITLGLLIIANVLLRPRLPPKRNSAQASLRTIIKDVPFLFFMLGAFLLFLGVFVPFFYLQLYAVLHGVDVRFSKYAITIMNAGSLLGRTLPNIVADLLIISSIFTGSLIFAMFGATSLAGVAAFSVFYGFFSGGVVSLAAPAVGSFVTNPDLSDLGIRIGMTSFALAFALLTGNPIAGALLTSERHWQRPLTFAAIAVFAGAACHLSVWKASVARRGKKTV
ncbi:major facilitator superfamily domain-containing protein [Ephemerocybe angulata]|uniref:Major facilitator superfamily domain-containing protein n=1 Tax=Ephemerocybe angulata TaxID=980116 RepID=A0A8H6HUX8_9AGAR|nr:major facilitator superfamily domain-containing protein [Tulosesus angulatus]